MSYKNISMDTLISLVLASLIGWILYREIVPSAVTSPTSSRRRLCDYYAAGSVFEDVSSALARGIRVLEVHLYSDEDDQPVVATTAQTQGHDVAVDNVSFESVCVAITNDAFPSSDPCVLSIVPHTEKTIVLNRAAEILQTTVRRHLIKGTNIHLAPIDSLADKLILVSGGHIVGSDLEPLINLSWTDTPLRRLTYTQALYPRDPEELKGFNLNNISLVAADPDFTPPTLHPNTPAVVYGCQWNFYVSGPGGFHAK